MIYRAVKVSEVVILGPMFATALTDKTIAKLRWLLTVDICIS